MKPVDDQTPAEIANALRLALRGLASAVTIVTCRDAAGEDWAMTASSPTSVSLEPPSMLVCVNRQTPFYTAIQQAECFAINILAQSHKEDATLCAGAASGKERFQNAHWQTSDHGLATLNDAQSVIICQRDHIISYGTHDIIIGLVKTVVLNPTTDPLLYVNGAYYGLGQPL